MSVSEPRPDRSTERKLVEDADVEIATEAGRVRHHPLVRTLGALSEIADQAPSFVACGTILAAGLATGRHRVAKAGAGMLSSVLVAAVLKSGVKALVSRTRPHAMLDGEAYAFEIGGRNGPHDQSFPSGHTAGAVAAARGLARVYPAASGPAYASAAAIALIQLPRAKHYPADLAAGAVVGLVAEAMVSMAASAIGKRLSGSGNKAPTRESRSRAGRGIEVGVRPEAPPLRRPLGGGHPRTGGSLRPGSGG